MSDNKATAVYRKRRAQIDAMLAAIETGLSDFDRDQADNPNDWGFAGSAQDVVEKLAATAYAVGGITAEQVKRITGKEF